MPAILAIVALLSPRFFLCVCPAVSHAVHQTYHRAALHHRRANTFRFTVVAIHHFTSAILPAAIATYEGLISHPTKPRPMRLATTPVVPLPANGSSTTPPSGQPAKMHGSISFSGNTAKCAPRNPFVLSLQTHRSSVVPRLKVQIFQFSENRTRVFSIDHK